MIFDDDALQSVPSCVYVYVCVCVSSFFFVSFGLVLFFLDLSCFWHDILFILVPILSYFALPGPVQRALADLDGESDASSVASVPGSVQCQ